MNKPSEKNKLRLSMIDWVRLVQSRRGDPLLKDISLVCPKKISSQDVSKKSINNFKVNISNIFF
jgi:hypothetical protein